MIDSITFSSAYPGGNVDRSLLPVAGDIERIKPFRSGLNCKLLSMNSLVTDISTNLSLQSAYLHDSIYGISMLTSPLEIVGLNILPECGLTAMRSGDKLRMIANATIAQQIPVSLSLYYDMIDGMEGKRASFITAEDFDKLFVNWHVLCIQTAPTLAYFTPISIADPNLLKTFKYNRRYALIGGVGTNSPSFLRFTSPDIGNLKPVLPLDDLYYYPSQNYFYRLSQRVGGACIPVFDGQNILNLFIDSLGNVGDNINLFFAEIN